MKLIDAPIGLFMFGETLCVKTEYANLQYGVEAYIVESGEIFWGGAKTKEERHNLDVTPVTADNLRPHGLWGRIFQEDYCALWCEFECSECGEKFAYDEDIIPYNFCPHCGAKMDQEGETP